MEKKIVTSMVAKAIEETIIIDIAAENPQKYDNRKNIIVEYCGINKE
jgi:hypothetical protein